MAKLAADGGIVEERIVGEELRSPSVQLRVLPGGTVELLSTHDQLLGGPSGQSYLGCVFPADPAYARLITEPAMAIGERLADKGVLGRFAVDFVVVRDAAGGWTPYAIEVNLRKGGTTHPFLTLQFLTDGRYDPVDRALPHRPRRREAPGGHRPPRVRRAPGLSVGDLFDVVGPARPALRPVPAGRHRLPHDQRLTEHGRVGMTAVGDTRRTRWSCSNTRATCSSRRRGAGGIAGPPPMSGPRPRGQARPVKCGVRFSWNAANPSR